MPHVQVVLADNSFRDIGNSEMLALAFRHIFSLNDVYYLIGYT